MGNPPRYIPGPGRRLVEVTTRTLHGKFLLRPSPLLNSIVVGILARAARRHDVGIVAFVVMSNHVHLHLLPKDARELAGFMEYFNGNLAKEAGRLHQWQEKLWGRRYRAIVVSSEPKAQIERLRYLLEHGCKEGLVRKPSEWPGASSTEALLTGRPIEGWWFDRTEEYEARRRRESFTPYAFATPEEVTLVPLPCWENLPPEEYRRCVAEIVREIERETRDRLARENRGPLGVRRILRQSPHDGPERPSRSPAPRFHAASAGVRKALELAFHEFRVRYREASEALRNGTRNVEFPPGSFPPRLPFCTAKDPPVPGLSRA